ncbi:MAG TPA: hypothetical protein VD978_12175 [Azospirillum sp.]|nr:hypothetical protein [Azospirillum sp.]
MGTIYLNDDQFDTTHSTITSSLLSHMAQRVCEITGRTMEEDALHDRIGSDHSQEMRERLRDLVRDMLTLSADIWPERARDAQS